MHKMHSGAARDGVEREGIGGEGDYTGSGRKMSKPPSDSHEAWSHGLE